jgi:hypothetical protein
MKEKLMLKVKDMAMVDAHTSMVLHTKDHGSMVKSRARVLKERRMEPSMMANGTEI